MLPFAVVNHYLSFLRAPYAPLVNVNLMEYADGMYSESILFRITTEYPGANCALIAAVSGLSAGCAYSISGVARHPPRHHRLSIFAGLYSGLIGLIRGPLPHVHFFHGLIVAPARFASTFHFLDQVWSDLSNLQMMHSWTLRISQTHW